MASLFKNFFRAVKFEILIFLVLVKFIQFFLADLFVSFKPQPMRYFIEVQAQAIFVFQSRLQDLKFQGHSVETNLMDFLQFPPISTEPIHLIELLARFSLLLFLRQFILNTHRLHCYLKFKEQGKYLPLQLKFLKKRHKNFQLQCKGKFFYLLENNMYKNQMVL